MLLVLNMGNPLEILQPTPWEPVSIVEVVNKVGAGAMATNFKTS